MARGQFIVAALALWLLIEVVLGPVLAVIASERIERTPQLLTAEPHGAGEVTQ